MNNSEYNLLTKEQIVEKYDNLFDYAVQLAEELERAKQKIDELEYENCLLYDDGFSDGKDSGYSEGYSDGMEVFSECGDKDERF